MVRQFDHDESWISTKDLKDNTSVHVQSFFDLFHLIVVDVVGPVDVHGLVGVDADADLTDVGVDKAGRVTSFQVGKEALHVDLR